MAAEPIMRYLRYLRTLGAALAAALMLAAAGCHSGDSESITPKHPVALPPPSAFTAPPHKGGMVGALPTGGGAPAGAASGASPSAGAHR